MNNVVFITGNQHKADYLAKWLDITLEHQRVDLTEIQSLDLHEVVADKARRAYEVVKKPVLVEDVALSFEAFGRLPGTFIKWYIQELGNERICRIVDGQSRAATASICFCLYDGRQTRFFEASMPGSIADHPRGKNGFGWDEIFMSDGMDKTRAELTDEEMAATSMRAVALAKLKAYLTK